MSLIELAIRMALEAHAGQTDKAGKPYILHALRVLAAVGHGKPEDVQCAAVLHDVLEDCPAYDAPLLAARGFSPRTINLVQMLSRDEGETYDAFIDRICQDRDASWIKLCDLRDNMDLTRLSRPLSHTQMDRYYKYVKACAVIQATWGFPHAN